MNDTTFQSDGEIAFVPVVVNAKPPKHGTGGQVMANLIKRIKCLLGQHEYNTAEWRLKKLAAGHYKVYQECKNCRKAHYVTIYVPEPGDVEIWEN